MVKVLSIGSTVSLVFVETFQSEKVGEAKLIHDFPTSFLAHLERARKEKDRRLIKAYNIEVDDTFKKFSHKKDITCDLYYNVFCGDVADMIQTLPKKEYTIMAANIPYGFCMVGSLID